MLLKKKNIHKTSICNNKETRALFFFCLFFKMASVSTRKHLDLLIIVICGVAKVTKF